MRFGARSLRVTPASRRRRNSPPSAFAAHPAETGLSAIAPLPLGESPMNYTQSRVRARLHRVWQALRQSAALGLSRLSRPAGGGLRPAFGAAASSPATPSRAARPASGVTPALLPVPEGFQPDLPVGFTPLVRASRLGKRIGAASLYVKNDAVCFPTLSFKDRVVAVALANAQKFGFETVGCSSTGNLANSVAAQAARLGLRHAFWFPPTWSRQRF